MPARSAAQRRWAFGRMGAAWARKHHFDTGGKLPEHVTPGKALAHARKRKKRRKR